MAYRRKKRRRTNNNFFSYLIVIIVVAWGIYTKLGTDPNGNKTINDFINQVNSQTPSNTDNAIDNAAKANVAYGGLSKQDYQKLTKLDFKSGSKGYILVNHNHSTLIENAWRINKVIYANLDSLNRTSHSNTGFLEKQNVANDSLRVRQFVAPTAWHYNRKNGTQIYNRGHLIAYSVSAGIDQGGNYNPDNQSGDQNNPKNLFTQSAFSNQRIQTIFEGEVRNALRQNKKVIYQATPIFRGDELMARGINLQAVSTDGTLNFNVYLFNVEPGYIFNYNNGQAKIDHKIKVTE